MHLPAKLWFAAGLLLATPAIRPQGVTAIPSDPGTTSAVEMPNGHGSELQGRHRAAMAERFGKPYVFVTINGRGPFRFVIDTGTGADVVITPELANQLQLPTVGHTSIGDPSGQGSRAATIVSLDSLELAGVTFRGVRAVRLGFVAEAGSCAGLLGFTLFRNLLLTLDFPNRSVFLESGSLAPDGEQDVLPFRMPDGVPVVQLRLAGMAPVDAQLDSGGGGLVLPERLVPHLAFDVAPVVFASGRSVATRFELKAARLGSDVQMGRYTFEHPVVEIHPTFPLINFGSPPMQNFAITFDQRNRLVRFRANSSKFRLSAPPSPPRLDLEPRPQLPDPTLVPVG